MMKEVKQFIDNHVSMVKPLATSLNYAYWDVNVNPTPEAQQKLEKLTGELNLIYANKEDFKKLREWKSKLHDQNQDPILKREVELLLNAYAMNQGEEEDILRMAKLQTDAEAIYSTFRAEVDGIKYSSNQIEEVLKTSLDTNFRKKIWEASKTIGEKVEGIVKELVFLRNKIAKLNGYKNYYEMALQTQELDPKYLNSLLKALTRETDEAFVNWKKVQDKEIARKFNCKEKDLRPWHYSDPFFARVPTDQTASLDSWFEKKDLEKLTDYTFDQLGLGIKPILKKSDLYARENKCQHAFCANLDFNRDIRVLCNLEPNEYWMGVMLHEFGHAAYDNFIDPNLPFILKRPAHILTTEAMAMLMGRQTHNPAWLKEVAHIPDNEVTKSLMAIRKTQAAGMILFIRWALVMVDFESAMYSKSAVNLNKLWWELVIKYQNVTPPDGRDAPDWASKIHLVLAPVYYQNYILGELFASQIQAFVTEKLGGLINNKNAGEYLKSKIFSKGSLRPWNELVTEATGSELKINPFLNDYIPAL